MLQFCQVEQKESKEGFAFQYHTQTSHLGQLMIPIGLGCSSQLCWKAEPHLYVLTKQKPCFVYLEN